MASALELMDGDLDLSLGVSILTKHLGIFGHMIYISCSKHRSSLEVNLETKEVVPEGCTWTYRDLQACISFRMWTPGSGELPRKICWLPVLHNYLCFHYFCLINLPMCIIFGYKTYRLLNRSNFEVHGC